MKAFMTARNTGTQKISFKQAPQDNNPLARVDKRLRYLLGSGKKDHVSIAEMWIREIRPSLQEIKRLAAKNPGPEFGSVVCYSRLVDHKAGNSSLANTDA